MAKRRSMKDGASRSSGARRRKSQPTSKMAAYARHGHPEIPDALVTAARHDELVLYVGSSLSLPAGYPRWGDLVGKLVEWRSRTSRVPAELRASWSKSMAAGDYDAVADSCVGGTGVTNQELVGFLRHMLDNSSRRPSPWISLLPPLQPRAILTTNFDDLLEQQFADWAVMTPLDTEAVLQASSANTRHIVKLHGRLEEPNSVLLSPMQFEMAMAENRLFAKYVDAVFASRTILFIGATVEGIDAYLRGLRLSGSAMPERHFALVPDDGGDWRTRAESISRRFGIRFIPYDPADGHHDLAVFLEEMAGQIAAVPHLEPVGFRSHREESAGRPWLRRVVLENIGPFERQEFVFTADWNILIGDNGVGKSTVLKAVAVAMCGDDAQSFAGRLIRVGQPHGRIVLQTSKGDEYRTEIFAKDAIAEVRSVPARPMEAENWLAVGFPALRVLPYASASNIVTAGSGPSRLTANDLVPLLSGEPDARATSVRQWLNGLDYRIRLNGPDATAAREVRSRFVAAIEKLLQGTFIKVIDADARKAASDQMSGHASRSHEGNFGDEGSLFVRTVEGVLPIEAVSQGAISLFGWVGVLLQRQAELAEQPGARPRPTLILVDEVDAHMHPGWQWTLVEVVTSLCPEVQFIATTHSPLIVGCLGPRQVHSLRRTGAQHAVQVQLVEESLTGYRADQILTHDAFGMPTTRSRDASRKLDRFQELMGISNLSQHELAERERLSAELKVEVPLADETPLERRAAVELDDYLDQRVIELDPERKRKVMMEAKQMLTRMRMNAGATRPGGAKL